MSWNGSGGEFVKRAAVLTEADRRASGGRVKLSSLRSKLTAPLMVAKGDAAGRRCQSPGCEKMLERRKDEESGNFARRKTCGKEAGCAVKLSAAMNTTVKIIAGRCCPSCKKLLKRKEDEPLSLFARRKTCSRKKCVRKLLTTTKVVAGRLCPICKKTLKRKMGEPLCRFAKRKTCGNKKCSALLTATKTTTTKIVAGRRCPICGETLEQRAGESPKTFARRVTCSRGNRACAYKLIATKNTTSKIITGRRCPSCKKLLQRREGERLRGFAKRTTCGKAKCLRKLQTTIKVIAGRRCLVCEEALKRKTSESRKDFACRKTCGHGTCRDTLLSRLWRSVPVRFCPAPSCGKELERREGERRDLFRRRKVCDERCRAKLQSEARTTTKIVAGRCCPICSKVLEQKKGEALCNFAKRKTCGKKAGCAAKLSEMNTTGKTTLFHGAHIWAAAELLVVSGRALRAWQRGGIAIDAAIERSLQRLSNCAERALV